MHTYGISLEGRFPRITDVDLVNYSTKSVKFNPGDAVDINVQRSLGSIGDYYEGDVKLPLECCGSNRVIDLNEHEEVEDATFSNQGNTVQEHC